MLSRLHILLTYSCPLRCKHCFVFAGPRAKGTFTSPQITRLLTEAYELGSIEWVFFEGGEPFYHYPLLLQSINKACRADFSVGVFTNGYFARDVRTAARLLRPLQELGVARLYVSDDPLHYRSAQDTPAQRTLRAAEQLGFPASQLGVESAPNDECADPRLMGSESHFAFQLRWRGRAVDKLSPLMPLEGWERYTQCPNQDLGDPQRLDVDAYGNVQICQGISLGNAWETSLPEVVSNYLPGDHPILGPLLRGGPAALAQSHHCDPAETYADPCHLCYATRQAMLERYPAHLAPRQVYGL